jgi:hypothetical protein
MEGYSLCAGTAHRKPMNLAVSFFRLPQVVACFTKSFDVLILVSFKGDDHFERLFILNGDGCSTESLWV